MFYLLFCLQKQTLVTGKSHKSQHDFSLLSYNNIRQKLATHTNKILLFPIGFFHSKPQQASQLHLTKHLFYCYIINLFNDYIILPDTSQLITLAPSNPTNLHRRMSIPFPMQHCCSTYRYGKPCLKISVYRFGLECVLCGSIYLL